MTSRAPPMRKTSGSRLKPVADSLETVGFVSKGDRKSASDDATKNPPASLPTKPTGTSTPSAASELSTILLSLRKLREAVLATASAIPIIFSQQVHLFSVKIAIRAQHPPSYTPSLRYLMEKLHTPSHPLPDSDLKEVISYQILDSACRQQDLGAAYELRARARRKYAFNSSMVDEVLHALAHDDWVIFWRIRRGVDSNIRAVLNWAEERVRRHALKAVGKAYLNADSKWITEGCTGEKELTWEKLVEMEKLGWEKEGDKIIIRRPKQKPPVNLTPIKEAL